jgi:hypothetical protein
LHLRSPDTLRFLHYDLDSSDHSLRSDLGHPSVPLADHSSSRSSLLLASSASSFPVDLLEKDLPSSPSSLAHFLSYLAGDSYSARGLASPAHTLHSDLGHPEEMLQTSQPSSIHRPSAPPSSFDIVIGNSETKSHNASAQASVDSTTAVIVDDDDAGLNYGIVKEDAGIDDDAGLNYGIVKEDAGIDAVSNSHSVSNSPERRTHSQLPNHL